MGSNTVVVVRRRRLHTDDAAEIYAYCVCESLDFLYGDSSEGGEDEPVSLL